MIEILDTVRHPIALLVVTVAPSAILYWCLIHLSPLSGAASVQLKQRYGAEYERRYPEEVPHLVPRLSLDSSRR